MLEDVKPYLRESKAAIDEVFGEGYARSNPTLLDRVLQIQFRLTRSSGTQTKLVELDETLYNAVKDVIETSPLVIERTYKGDVIKASEVFTKVAIKLNLYNDNVLKSRIYRIMNTLFGVDKPIQYTIYTTAGKYRVRGYLKSNYKYLASIRGEQDAHS